MGLSTQQITLDLGTDVLARDNKTRMTLLQPQSSEHNHCWLLPTRIDTNVLEVTYVIYGPAHDWAENPLFLIALDVTLRSHPHKKKSRHELTEQIAL